LVSDEARSDTGAGRASVAGFLGARDEAAALAVMLVRAGATRPPVLDGGLLSSATAPPATMTTTATAAAVDRALILSPGPGDGGPGGAWAPAG